MAQLSINVGQDRSLLLRTSSDSVLHLNPLSTQKSAIPELDRRSLTTTDDRRLFALYGSSRQGSKPTPLSLGKFTLSPVNLVSSRGFSRSAAGLQWSESVQPPITTEVGWSPFRTEYTSKFSPPPATHMAQRLPPRSSGGSSSAPRLPHHLPLGIIPPERPVRVPHNWPTAATPHGVQFHSSPHGTPLDFGHSFHDNAALNARMSCK
mmetsp:Transcript_25374/g.51008  ORF Transcript_25374/g.51008 Transcript_25374/m.51008 type:complete len:207 (-) Transcript_25374:229-849(-)